MTQKKWMRRSMVVLVSTAFVGCSTKPATSDGAAESAPTITGLLTVGPGDGLTDIETTPITVSVASAGEVSDALMKQLSTSVSLVLFPEMTVVDADVSVVNNTQIQPPPVAVPKGTAPPPYTPRADSAVITVTPREKLVDRWYAVSIPSAPSTVAVDASTAWVRADGSLLSRFRPGSQPTLLAVSRTDRGNGTMTLRISFSQGFIGAEGENLTPTLHDETTGIDCTVYANSDFDSSRLLSSYQVSCGGATVTDQLTLTLPRRADGSAVVALMTKEGASSLPVDVALQKGSQAGGSYVWAPMR